MNVRYREWAPHPRLRPWVRCLWMLEHPARATAPERVLPDGCDELVLHYGDRFRQHVDGVPRLQPRGLLVSAQRRFLLIEPTGRAGMVGVRFVPGGAHRFLGVPLDRLDAPATDVADVWGPAGRELEARVAEAADAGTRATIVESFLAGHLDDSRPDVVDAALQHIVASGGAARVRDLARDARVSPRTLERRFGAQVGLSPKELCRIVRFQRVLHSLHDPRPGRTWADVAAAAGFADQAHLTRDFREISGLPPAAFGREPHAYTALFVGDAAH